MKDEQNIVMPSLRQTIDKTTYEVVLHFNDQSTQTVEDKLRRVVLHDLKQRKIKEN